MKEIQFVFNGGLGNQIFQYLASKYIGNRFKYININYAFSDYIIDGIRDFGLNDLLINPIKINKENSYLTERLLSKILNSSLDRAIFISEMQKYKIKMGINFNLNLFKEDSKNIIYKYNSLQILAENLDSFFYSKSKLKVYGFWQNPTNYIIEIEKYKKIFKNNYFAYSDQIRPNKYISIHIRRGDYLSNKKILNHYFSKFSPVEFILMSLNLIPSQFINYPIYLISDDLSWRNEIIEILSKRITNKFIVIDKNDDLTEWSILRHSTINICSNSTFGYTAALLNPENVDQKLRCIIPQWINKNETAFEKGWLTQKGFITI